MRDMITTKCLALGLPAHRRGGVGGGGSNHTSQFSVVKSLLPKFQSLALRDEHLVTLLDAKGIVPHIDMWQRTVYAPLTQ